MPDIVERLATVENELKHLRDQLADHHQENHDLSLKTYNQTLTINGRVGVLETKAQITEAVQERLGRHKDAMREWVKWLIATVVALIAAGVFRHLGW